MVSMPTVDYRRENGSKSLAISMGLLAAPPLVLAFTAIAFHSTAAAVGAFAQFIMALLFLPYRSVWRPPASGLLIINFLMTLGWIWVATRHDPDGLARILRGLVLLATVGLFVLHDLQRSGLLARRRAHKLIKQLTRRTSWPRQLEQYADLPEVRELQDSLRYDPTPAIHLLSEPRSEIVIAALTAMQQRPYWRTSEADHVMLCIESSVNTQVKVAGLKCLASAGDAEIILEILGYLKDHDAAVRQAAASVLPIHDDNRWPILRDGIRAALASNQNETLFEDAVGHWSEAAVCDLTTWASEPEPLGTQAGKAVVAHYGTLLHAGHHPTLATEISDQITDPQTPARLRVDLAVLLRGLNFITPELLDRMTDVDQPGPLRILAAEMLLAWNPHNPDAVDVLRGLGRQSNRETALAIARLLQQFLGLDMGLPAGGVQPNSKQAAETAKRVFTWATGRASNPASNPSQGHHANQGTNTPLGRNSSQVPNVIFPQDS